MENKIEFKDRVSNTPNRRKIKIISQTADEIIADIEMADNPTESGTAINAEMLNNIQDIAYEALNQVTQKQGTIVQENGAYVNTFYADKKLDINQGASNANKVMTTDNSGNISPSDSIKLNDSIQLNDCKIYVDNDSNGELSYVIEFVSTGKKIYINQSTYDKINLPIGLIFQSAIKLEDPRFHMLNGSTISQLGIYSNFATMLKEKASEGKVPICDNATFENEVSLYGNCGKFVIDNENNTIRLPKITRFVQGLSDISNIGQSISAGLPNITGYAGFSYLSNENAWYSPNGALSSSYRNTLNEHAGAGSSQREYSFNLNFDASKSTAVSNIYGKSNTVQPQATQYPYYIVVANSVASNLQVNVNNILNDVELQNNIIENQGKDSWEYVTKYTLNQQIYQWIMMYDFDFDSYDYEFEGIIGVNHANPVIMGPVDTNGNVLNLGVRWGAIRLIDDNTSDVAAPISGWTVIQDNLANSMWLTDATKNGAHICINVKLKQDQIDNERIFFDTHVYSLYYGAQQVWFNHGMIFGEPITSKKIKGFRINSNGSTSEYTTENSYLVLRRRRKR